MKMKKIFYNIFIHSIIMEKLVEVRKSDKHGNGIFAIKDIPKNTKVCYYDGDDLTDNEARDKSLSHAMRHVKDKSLVRIGYENPKNEFGIGQLANDYIYPQININNDEIFQHDIKKMIMLFDAYNVISSLNTTLEFKDMENGDFWMSTTRKIKKDEELTFSYGKYYWIKHNLDICQNSLWRLMMYSIIEPIKFPLTEVFEKNIIETILVFDNNDKWKLFGIDETLSSNDKIKKLCDMLGLSNRE